MLIAIALAVPVAAQYPGGGSGTGRSGSGQGRSPTTDSRDATIRAPSGAELLQIQITELDEDLKLAPDQRRAWGAYVDRLQRLGSDIARNRNAMRFPAGNASQQFDFLADAIRNRLTAFEDVADAGKALYAVLTPEQREVADRRLARIAVTVIEGAATVAGPPAGDAAPGFIGGRSRRESK